MSEPTYAECMSKSCNLAWRGVVVHAHNGFDARAELVEQNKEQFSNESKGNAPERLVARSTETPESIQQRTRTMLLGNWNMCYNQIII